MFKVNPDGMRMEPTPERVLSVCRLVSHKSMSRDEVRQCMTLGINDEKEIQEYPVSELKFRPRKKKIKVSEQEMKELKNLEDKGGDSKLDED